MPRGGARPGAGRKPNPDSARQKKLAAKRSEQDLGRGLTLPNGQKSPDAPPDWPFGTRPPEPEGPAAEPLFDEDDDGLTPEQRAGMTPLDYLLAVMRSPNASKSARMTAAIQAAPYMHSKMAPKGKKEDAADRAKKTAKGRFGVRPAPLKLVGGG